MNNPKNHDVRGVKKKEIYQLFASCDINLKRITLAPPLARAIAPYSWLACYILEKIPFLRTHYLGVIRKSLKNCFSLIATDMLAGPASWRKVIIEKNADPVS